MAALSLPVVRFFKDFELCGFTGEWVVSGLFSLSQRDGQHTPLEMRQHSDIEDVSSKFSSDVGNSSASTVLCYG